MLAEEVYEELLIVFEGLTCPPNINREEDLSYYELSAIYFDPKDRQVSVWFHAGLSIVFPASSPNFSFRGPSGEKRQSKELFT